MQYQVARYPFGVGSMQTKSLQMIKTAYIEVNMIWSAQWTSLQLPQLSLPSYIFDQQKSSDKCLKNLDYCKDQATVPRFRFSK